MNDQTPDPWQDVDAYRRLMDATGRCVFLPTDKVDAARALDAQRLRDAEEWADIVTRGTSPCGHWKAYTYTEDGIGRRVSCWQCRAEQAQQEIADLKAALKDVTDDMDRAGGDGYGMPECPWCRADGMRDDDGDNWHQPDCSLLKARAILTPEAHHD